MSGDQRTRGSYIRRHRLAVTLPGQRGAAAFDPKAGSFAEGGLFRVKGRRRADGVSRKAAKWKDARACVVWRQTRSSTISVIDGL